MGICQETFLVYFINKFIFCQTIMQNESNNNILQNTVLKLPFVSRSWKLACMKYLTTSISKLTKNIFTVIFLSLFISVF